MSIIEKAAQRLEQLRNAGVDIPAANVAPSPTPAADPGTESPDSGMSAERTAADERAPAAQAVHLADAAPNPPGSSGPANAQSLAATEPARQSKTVEIDLAALAAAGYITPEGKRAQLADEFRVLKRPIINNARGGSGSTVERGNCVMVTSALPSEGKSFVALNLALSIATEVDSTVLLVDADVANPNLMKRMHLPASRGLLDLLTNKNTDLAEVLLRTNVEKLTLLPAGSPQRRATEMLASATMVDLVEQMATRYPDRILVFDSPPLLSTTEARVLASHMGQIIMVVEADATTQGAVLQALETIENCPIVMMLLNKAARTEVGGYYGYGSAYGAYGATG